MILVHLHYYRQPSSLGQHTVFSMQMYYFLVNTSRMLFIKRNFSETWVRQSDCQDFAMRLLWHANSATSLGYFLKSDGDKFSYKSGPNIWWL